jgi:hypothetical protein
MPTTVRAGDILFNNGTTQSTAATGSVSSVATGNGLQGGTITTTGTLSVACPGFNTVGSYCGLYIGSSVATNTNYAAGTVQSGAVIGTPPDTTLQQQSNISGTWRWMSAGNGGAPSFGLGCRVS